MTDTGRRKAVGSHRRGTTSTGLAPTGADTDSTGSSVETEEDIATLEDIPPTEAILRMAEERRKDQAERGRE